MEQHNIKSDETQEIPAYGMLSISLFASLALFLRYVSSICSIPHNDLIRTAIRPSSVRGTPYASDAHSSSASASDAHSSSASASDSRLPSASAPATSSLFRNAFGRMTSYATRSWPASAPDRMMSRDVAWCRKTHRPDPTSHPDISSDPPSVYDTLTRHVCRTLHVFPNFGLISYIHYFVY